MKLGTVHRALVGVAAVALNDDSNLNYLFIVLPSSCVKEDVKRLNKLLLLTGTCTGVLCCRFINGLIQRVVDVVRLFFVN